MSLLELFCHVDDFWQVFAPTFHARLIETGQRKLRRSSSLSTSEIMTRLDSLSPIALPHLQSLLH